MRLRELLFMGLSALFVALIAQPGLAEVQVERGPGPLSVLQTKSEIERQVALAEFIVIGRPLSYEMVEIEGAGTGKAAVVDVEYSVDGKISDEQIRVVVDAPYSHAYADCCYFGETYMFLLLEHQGLYYPVRDAGAVHLLSGKAPL